MINFLKSIPIFSDVNDKIIESASRMFYKRSYNKNEMIFAFGEIGDFLGFVISGRVKISIVSDSGKEIILDYLGRGDCIGEMSIFDNNTRSADAIATTPVTLALISKNDYIKFDHLIPRISIKIASIVSKRLRIANRRFESIISMPLSKRVADFLISCCDKSENYKINYTQKELGDLLGAQRESITRVLSKMKSQGIFRKSEKKREMKIDRDKLEKIYLSDK